jgi:hypothetical protein
MPQNEWGGLEGEVVNKWHLTGNYLRFILPTKTSGVVTAAKPIIGSQSCSREIQTVVQYKYILENFIFLNHQTFQRHSE